MEGKIVIKPSPDADTRSAEGIASRDTLWSSTMMHIRDVCRIMDWMGKRLSRLALKHDWTKIAYFEEFFTQFSKAKKTGVWGRGWFDRIHIRKERHHLKDRCPDDVNLFDVLEQIADGVAAGLARAGEYRQEPVDAEMLLRAYDNTVKLVLKQVELKQ